MSNINIEREKRRKVILEGISQDLNNSEIAIQLGVNRLVIINDLRKMRWDKDPELRQARKTQKKFREKEILMRTGIRNERFLLMTGMTFQEKSFSNMIEFYKPEIMKILKSNDQYAAIVDLPKSIIRTLVHNGILTKRGYKREITENALNYLRQFDD